MARLARLAIANHAHLVLLRGHNGKAVFQDDVDRACFLSALRDACTLERVALHAYALLPDQVWLLCTPSSGHALGRTMQSLGRRFSAAFNRRHRRSGSLWDGRYRATVLESGPRTLEAMIFVDQAPVRNKVIASAPDVAWSSARQHMGSESGHPLTDLAEYWALGNTPFDRAAAYRLLLEEPQDTVLAARLAAAVQRGWPVGSHGFLAGLAERSSRRVAPRPRGRPRKPPAPPQA
jgi:putative transposase